MVTRLVLFFHRPICFVLISVAALTATTEQAAALSWNWSYSGAGITAHGTFTSTDTHDGSGFYLVTGITGTRNGEIITGLQPTGTPIPGNEPFLVDNLVRLTTPQLTEHGFGYAIAGGTFSNPFFAGFLQPPEYLEFFSTPPFAPGVIGPEDSELPILFSATPASVPEPATWALMLAGLGILRLTRPCRKIERKRKFTFPTTRRALSTQLLPLEYPSGISYS